MTYSPQTPADHLPPCANTGSAVEGPGGRVEADYSQSPRRPDAFKTWAEVGAKVPEGAVRAIGTGGAAFLDEQNIGPKEDHYLILEGLEWRVVNALYGAGFEIKEISK